MSFSFRILMIYMICAAKYAEPVGIAPEKKEPSVTAALVRGGGHG
jgi:hypothetical protein